MIPKIKGGLMFMYYDGIGEAARFYEEILGFKLKLDRDWVKIYNYTSDCHVGLVDVNMGSHKVMDEKSARLQLMVEDAQAWHDYVKIKGLKPSKDKLKEGMKLHIKAFSVNDPGGYTVEFCEYTTPYGDS
jgi:catechol 2,3-dioxygenase-like lactoylglutathione lyase family enzyme